MGQKQINEIYHGPRLSWINDQKKHKLGCKNWMNSGFKPYSVFLDFPFKGTKKSGKELKKDWSVMCRDWVAKWFRIIWKESGNILIALISSLINLATGTILKFVLRIRSAFIGISNVNNYVDTLL